MKRTPLLAAGTLLVVVVALLLLPSLTGPRLGVERVRIGVLTALTGPFAAWGTLVQAGAQMAEEELNGGGGILGARVELVVIDDKNDAREAITAFNRLVEVDRVVAVVGPISSGIGVALAPEAEKARVPLFLIASGTHRTHSLASRYVFRTCLPPAPINAEALVSLVKESGFRRVAVIYASYEWGFSIRDSLKQLISGLSGVEFRFEEAPLTETDFTTYLRKLQDFRPELIIATGHPPGAPTILKQAIELGLNPRYVVGSVHPLDAVVSVLGEEMATRGFATTSCANYDAPEYRQLAERFYRRFNRFFDMNALAGYVTVLMIANAIEKRGSADPVAVADYIRTTSYSHPAFSWPLSYTEYGELKAVTMTIATISRGEPGPMNPGAHWLPKVIYRAPPAGPYVPRE